MRGLSLWWIKHRAVGARIGRRHDIRRYLTSDQRRRWLHRCIDHATAHRLPARKMRVHSGRQARRWTAYRRHVAGHQQRRFMQAAKLAARRFGRGRRFERGARSGQGSEGAWPHCSHERDEMRKGERGAASPSRGNRRPASTPQPAARHRQGGMCCVVSERAACVP